ncbi:MAG: hypothetical protein KC931_24910, partial [Candidatus Omnitrophica bacterium]|nr:hypothetical protein [Candidatus Omnitrophota bacterium]
MARLVIAVSVVLWLAQCSLGQQESAGGPSGTQSVSEVLTLPIGERQLFLDDRVIDTTANLVRTLHQPEKKGAVVLPDRPWEVSLQTRCAPAYNPERGVFQLWMITSTNPSEDAGSSYAESRDGIVWDKPNLGQCEIAGTPDNNFICLEPGMKWPENAIENVVYDPDDPDPAKRYKGFLGCYDRDPIASPDGIHWTRLGVPRISSQDESN